MSEHANGSLTQPSAEHPPASADREPSPQFGTATVDLTISGHRVQARIEIPTGPIRTRQMLPVLQSLTDLVVDLGTKAEEERGERVSCREGCAACCRQIIPILEAEAYYLRDLVDRLPEPRRSEILARFAAARLRVKEAGILEAIRHPGRTPEDDPQAVGIQYLQLQIACPFLEEESCSIYPDRPLNCREYLVTTPAANCAQPTAETVRRVPLAAKVSHAAARLGQVQPTPIVPHVPLIMALEWADAHPEPPATRPGPELFKEVFDRLSPRKEKTS